MPEVLRSGDHGAVARWRQAESLARTLERRPDLVARRGGLTEAEVSLLSEHGYHELPGQPAPTEKDATHATH